METKAGFVSPS